MQEKENFQANKPMDSFGRVWRKHEERIRKNCNKLVCPEDTIVITGDYSQNPADGSEPCGRRTRLEMVNR